MLSCLYFYMNYKKNKYKIHLIPVYFLYLLGSLYKTSFYLFSIILIGYDFIESNEENNDSKKYQHYIKKFLVSIKKNVLFVLISFGFLLIPVLRLRMSWLNKTQGGFMSNPFMIVSRVLDYFKNVILPSYNYNILINTFIFSALLLFIIYYIFYSKNKIALFGLMWALVFGILFSVISIKAVYDIPRYMYTFSIGAYIFLASIINQEYNKKKKAIMYFIPVFLFIIYAITIFKDFTTVL